MATGDVQGNLGRLRAQARSIGYPHPVDLQGLKLGLPSAFLPLLHHAFLGYSRHVAKYLTSHDYELYAKSDLRFMECILKFLRLEFGYRCPLTMGQIFSRGFSERKLLFAHDAIQCCKRKHSEILKLSRRRLNEDYNIKPFGIPAAAAPKRKTEIHVQKRSACRSPRLAGADLDASLPRKFQSSSAKQVDSSLPVRLHVRSKSTSPLKQDRHAKRPVSQGSSPKRDRHSPASSKRDQTSPIKIVQVSSSPKRRSPVGIPSQTQNVDAALTRNAEVISLCYDELKGKIDEIAEKLESRFGNIERSFLKSTTNLEAKFSTLESRVKCLEKGYSVEVNHCSRHSPPRTENCTCRRSFSPEIKISSPIRDISNLNNAAFRSPKASACIYTHSHLRDELTTQELIANIKARCNRTRELLNQSRRFP